MKRRDWLRLALLLSSVAVAYASAPRNGFVWDDHKVIERGLLIGSLANIPTLFVHDAMFNSDAGRYAATATIDTYRPLTMTTFFVEHALFGTRAWAYHVDNVLIHLINILLLFAVARRLGLSENGALLASLFFAVHPTISEAVHWVNGRSDPLCVGLFLSSLWVWLRWVRTNRFSLGGAVAIAALMTLAALAKETAFFLVPPLLVMLRSLELRGRRAPLALLPYFVGGTAGFALRWFGLRRIAVGAGAAHLTYAMARAPALLADGARSLIAPLFEVQPSLYESYRLIPVWRTVLALALFAALWIACVRLWRRNQPLVALASAMLVFTLAPIALLTFYRSWTGWGRYLYPAAPFVCIAIVSTVQTLSRRLPSRTQTLIAGAASLGILFCAVETLAAGRVWHDERSFALAKIADHPELSTGYSELAVVELEDNNPGAALTNAEHAIQIEPDDPHHWSRAAIALMRLDRRDEAYAAATRALTLDGSDNSSRHILVSQLLDLNRQADAARLLLDVLLAEPSRKGAWLTLEQKLSELGVHSEFANIVQHAPADPHCAAIAAQLRQALNDSGE